MNTVFTNGNIYLERERFAQAMWVQDGVIRAVGSEAEVLAAAPADSAQHNLAGATVIPGFNDSHLHMRTLGMNLKVVGLHNVDTLQECIDRGRRFIEEHQLPAGELLVGRGWNHDYFTDVSRMPNRHDLDQISTEHPVYYIRTCGHAISVNTKMLEMAGIDANTPQPEGGAYETEADGTPNGVFHECGSTVFAAILPQPNVDTYADDLRTALEYASSMGITTVQSNDISEDNYHEMWQALQLLRTRGQLSARYYAQCTFTNTEDYGAFLAEGNVRGQGDDMLQVGPLKMFVDGSLGARTALLRGHYADDEGAQGIQTLTDEVFDAMVRLADQHNTSVITHAIGDGAIEHVLNSYAKVIEGGRNPNRHGVVHVQITDRALLDRFAENDILALVQPIFIHYDMHIVADRVGAELASSSYAFGTLTRMGVHTSYGTDCPVEDLNPFENLYTAVARRDLKGRPAEGYFPDEAVDIYTAIDNYTLESAYVCYAEGRRGRLLPGFQADFVVLDADIFTVPQEQIMTVRPVATYVDGQEVYQKAH